MKNQTKAMEVDKGARRMTPRTPVVQWWVGKKEPETKTKEEELKGSRVIQS